MSATPTPIRTPYHDYLELSPDDLDREIARLEDKLQFARYARTKQRSAGLFHERLRQWERIRPIAIGSSLIAATGLPFELDESDGSHRAFVVVGTVPKGETVPFASEVSPSRFVKGTPRAAILVSVDKHGTMTFAQAMGQVLPEHIARPVESVFLILAADLLRSMGVAVVT